MDRVEEHLKRFQPDAENDAMLRRLRQIADGVLIAESYDENFYAHELRELERYIKLGWPKGEPNDDVVAYELWNNVHTATLEDYGMSDNDLYHPSVRGLP